MSRNLSRKVSRNTMSTDVAVEEVSRNEAKTQKRSSIDPPAIEKLSRVQELSRSIHLAVEDLLRLR